MPKVQHIIIQSVAPNTSPPNVFSLKPRFKASRPYQISQNASKKVLKCIQKSVQRIYIYIYSGTWLFFSTKNQKSPVDRSRPAIGSERTGLRSVSLPRDGHPESGTWTYWVCLKIGYPKKCDYVKLFSLSKSQSLDIAKCQTHPKSFITYTYTYT